MIRKKEVIVKMMGHGKHHNCAMCSMAKSIGMMEKHPKDCDCEAHPENKDEKKSEGKVDANSGL